MCETEVTATKQKHGRYKKEKLIRKTLFGQIYRGTDLQTNNYVAIKESYVFLSQNKFCLEGFEVIEDIENEISTLEYLSTSDETSPHVLQYLDSYTYKNRLYIIFEYLDGGELFDYVLDRGDGEPVGGFEDETREQMRQLLAGVNYIHSKYIAHRDISLENIMFDKNGTVKLIDFGMCSGGPCSSFAKGDWIADNPTEQRIGKKQYMAPEISTNVEYEARLADVWSCGVIFFILLTGMPPFAEAQPDQKKFDLIFSGDLEYVLHYFGFKKFSDECLDLLQRMLSPEKDRISAQDALEHPFFQ